MKTSGNTILMTGGSGIGAALAHRFQDHGDTVIIVGGCQEALEQAAAGRNRIHQATQGR